MDFKSLNPSFLNSNLPKYKKYRQNNISYIKYEKIKCKSLINRDSIFKNYIEKIKVFTFEQD